jgi:hypothetical protein
MVSLRFLVCKIIRVVCYLPLRTFGLLIITFVGVYLSLFVLKLPLRMSVLQTIAYVCVAYNYICAYEYDNCDIYITLSVLVRTILLVVNLINIAMLLNLDKNDISDKSFRT